MTSSALLTQYGVMIGGGAGVAPSTIAASTTTTQALFATAGAPAFRAIAAGDLPGTLNATTFGGDVSLGANKLKTTNLLLKEASATYMGIRTAADDAWRYLQCLGVYFESDYPITINKNGASYLQPASATYTNYVLNLQGATGAALATVARVVSGATPYFDIPASGDVVPAVDNTYYCGDYLKGYKGIIVKDTVLAAYYAIQVVSGVVTAVAVTS